MFLPRVSQVGPFFNVIYNCVPKLCVTIAGGVLFGYDVGVISGAKVQVAHEMELTCGQEEALVNSFPFQLNDLAY
jgi:hypothetical protein